MNKLSKIVLMVLLLTGIASAAVYVHFNQQAVATTSIEGESPGIDILLDDGTSTGTGVATRTIEPQPDGELHLGLILSNPQQTVQSGTLQITITCDEGLSSNDGVNPDDFVLTSSGGADIVTSANYEYVYTCGTISIPAGDSTNHLVTIAFNSNAFGTYTFTSEMIH